MSAQSAAEGVSPDLVRVPAPVNAHSHAFHRILRGRTHHGGGDFWVWREQMYDAASVLTPEGYQKLAEAHLYKTLCKIKSVREKRRMETCIDQGGKLRDFQFQGGLDSNFCGGDSRGGFESGSCCYRARMRLRLAVFSWRFDRWKSKLWS